MAVKPVYGIKTPMLSTALDTEITLQKDGVGLKPLPVKFVIITIVSGLGGLKLLLSPPVNTGTSLQQIVFLALWVTITILLFGTDKTQRMRFQLLISLLNYLSVPFNRKVDVGKDTNAEPMIDMTNLAHIDNDGMVHFADKDVGYVFRVVGTASVLLFEEDKNRIINSVDNFYRKIDPETEFIYITLKEPQKIYNQTGAVRKRMNNLQIDDPDLRDLGSNQQMMLREVVGKKYQSIHQYLILKSKGQESLTAAKIAVSNELSHSGMVIKRCIQLKREEICEVWSLLYKVPEVEDDGSDTIKRNGVERNKTIDEKEGVFERNGKSVRAVAVKAG
jgi:hypothetical protein